MQIMTVNPTGRFWQKTWLTTPRFQSFLSSFKKNLTKIQKTAFNAYHCKHTLRFVEKTWLMTPHFQSFLSTFQKNLTKNVGDNAKTSERGPVTFLDKFWTPHKIFVFKVPNFQKSKIGRLQKFKIEKVLCQVLYPFFLISVSFRISHFRFVFELISCWFLTFIIIYPLYLQYIFKITTFKNYYCYPNNTKHRMV